MKSPVKQSCVSILGVAALSASVWGWAQQASPAPVAGSAADNTQSNARDRDASTTLPTDQSNTTTDIKLAAAVRRAIVADKTLSANAHNVKLVANAGVVILRGPVTSEAEKAKVEQIVSDVPGVARVDNNLDVKVSKTKE